MKKSILLLVLFSSLAVTYKVNGQLVYTVAGTGGGSYGGDGGAATAAALYEPWATTLDTAGNVYIADSHNNRIRKVTTSGIISTIAGNGTASYSGDGGAATAASIDYPTGVAVDLSGNVYISDNNNYRIRKISPSGIITTVAGTGTAGYSGDGGPATAAKLVTPSGIVIDASGNVIFADTYNHVVRKITVATGIITRLAGTGGSGFSGDGGSALSAALSEPQDVALDPAGNLYIADLNNSCIRKVNTSGIISTVAGRATYVGYTGDGGPATAALLYYPTGVAADGAGNIFIADGTNQVVRKVNAAGIITTFAGTTSFGYSSDGYPATATAVHYPVDVVVSPGGDVYYADELWNQVRKVINCLPRVSAITGGSGMCIGATLALADTTSGGTWSSSATGVATVSSTGLVTSLSAGTTTISYTATNACGTSAATQLVTVSPYPSSGSISYAAALCQGATISLSSTAAGGVWSSSAAGIATVGSSGNVTGVAAGTAIISYTVTNSCSTATDTQMITVYPLPSAGAISGPATLCQGSSITLTDTASGGLWTSSSPGIASVTAGIVYGVGTGTATISYTVIGAFCTNTATATVTVITVPLPGAISGRADVCETSTITLTESAAGGTWSSSNTALATVSATGTVTGIAAGSAVISYTITNTCGPSNATHPVNVIAIADCPASVASYNTGVSFSVFPNPASGKVTIDLAGGNGFTLVEVYNLMGQKAYSAENETPKFEIDLNNWPTGTYLIKLNNAGDTYTSKVIVQ